MSESEIRTISSRRAEQIGRREFDAMVDAFYDESAQLLASGVATVRGRDAIRGFWRDAPEAGLVALTLETREVHASGDLAYEVGSFSRTLRPRHGAPFQEVGKYMVVYRLARDGAWRAVAEMFNTDSRR